MVQAEEREVALKRLRMRSWRRGMKEMDLILGPFADRALAELPQEELAPYEELLAENDQDLYRWVTGAEAVPAAYAGLIDRLRRFHGIG